LTGNIIRKKRRIKKLIRGDMKKERKIGEEEGWKSMMTDVKNKKQDQVEPIIAADADMRMWK
jgi:hypothetical protein